MNQNDVVARLDRLESLDAIRQLAAKYSLALDMRDIDALVNLFAEDIRIGKDKVGRAHFKKWMDETLRIQFTGTAHHIGNHIIEFEDPDFAADGRDALYYIRAHEQPIATINGGNLRTDFDDQGNAINTDPCFGDYRTAEKDDCQKPLSQQAWSSPIFVNFKQ